MRAGRHSGGPEASGFRTRSARPVPLYRGKKTAHDRDGARSRGGRGPGRGRGLRGEVPVGAVVLGAGRNGASGRAGNEVEARGRRPGGPRRNAGASRRRETRVGTPRLPGCDLIVTLEPCPMCAPRREPVPHPADRFRSLRSEGRGHRAWRPCVRARIVPPPARGDRRRPRAGSGVAAASVTSRSGAELAHSAKSREAGWKPNSRCGHVR